MAIIIPIADPAITAENVCCFNAILAYIVKKVIIIKEKFMEAKYTEPHPYLSIINAAAEEAAAE